MPSILSGCCQRKNSRACANERIPRRHALATSHWQRYVSDQNTVAKYRPCSSTFCGNCSFCTLPKAPLLPEVSEADRYFLPKYKRHKFLYIVSMRKILILKTSCVYWRGGRLFADSILLRYSAFQLLTPAWKSP